MTDELYGTGEDIDRRQGYVRALLDWACIGGPKDELGPHYTAVTEHRDPANPKYSSCGDLAHWLLFRLGVRLHWINRSEHNGWTSGVNISRLASDAPLLCRKTPMPGARFEPGDILIVWNHPEGKDSHVMVVYEYSPSPTLFLVGEYGQPGGHVTSRTLVTREGHLFVGSRQVQRWLPLADVLTYAAEHDALVDVDLPEGIRPTDPAPPSESHVPS